MEHVTASPLSVEFGAHDCTISTHEAMEVLRWPGGGAVVVVVVVVVVVFGVGGTSGRGWFPELPMLSVPPRIAMTKTAATARPHNTCTTRRFIVDAMVPGSWF